MQANCWASWIQHSYPDDILCTKMKRHDCVSRNCTWCSEPLFAPKIMSWATTNNWQLFIIIPCFGYVSDKSIWNVYSHLFIRMDIPSMDLLQATWMLLLLTSKNDQCTQIVDQTAPMLAGIKPSSPRWPNHGENVQSMSFANKTWTKIWKWTNDSRILRRLFHVFLKRSRFRP